MTNNQATEQQKGELKPSQERMFVERAFESCIVNGWDLDGGSVQEELLDLGLIEERPVNPDENEYGADTLYFLKEPEARANSQTELEKLNQELVEALEKIKHVSNKGIAGYEDDLMCEDGVCECLVSNLETAEQVLQRHANLKKEGV